MSRIRDASFVILCRDLTCHEDELTLSCLLDLIRHITAQWPSSVASRIRHTQNEWPNITDVLEHAIGRVEVFEDDEGVAQAG